MVKIGNRITFVPAAFSGSNGVDNNMRAEADARYGVVHKVTGTVVYINWAHRWCSVEYILRGKSFRESFKLDEAGNPCLRNMSEPRPAEVQASDIRKRKKRKTNKK